MYFEIAIVILLALINGLLAMSELAIVSARPARLKMLADKGGKGAATAILLAEDPGRFLSSVQIGITLVGILAGAFSGATLGARLASSLLEAGVPAGLAQPIGVGSVVVAITYLSLIVGELVPKQIALRAPEQVAARVAPMMRIIARVAAPLIWVLDRSGKLVLRLLGQSGEQSRGVSDEEVRLIIAEAESSGAMNRAESQMIAGVMRVADRTARGLMTPRNEVETLDANIDKAALLQRLHDLSRSRVPVWDGEVDNIIGVLTTRDILAPALMNEPFDLRNLLREAPVVRDGKSALEVVDRLRTAPAHMVLVYDEYGHFEGIITPMDVQTAIAGEFPDHVTDELKVVTRTDGSYLVAGWMPVDEFAALLALDIAEDRDFETVAGLVLEEIGHLPDVGQVLKFQGWTIEVVDLDGRRIDKLLVSRAA
ncbi:HlyC/CorC family transporter [Sulfitobacter pseudonitzschiae]|uniref:HlyC/CorC family transporter n=1 Tax=Pseudosulfitobacter pseudonitzschiae TaxID=1402135 RepID=A0A9Q2RXH7_9RHOB|nr:HlyC/CorC family transporter [Pseudosulfitobacter pseudonitzschiae]MBM2299407.1 HlyC/CorC family transporter [Pseudosulfitobacter pseudonitzschiae]MBM2304271.1 HlyC/CorC family transporter [Pseudosulfitobacter pseudonitzschiae]MBM2314051.1 HlyC/CorC family transporter [Pseudosulfitobacter pseudonitzschiae]MBM2318966.1 HlyC/CorC family transporter [Pseudosulfitobacter pseudonitzschiae]